MKIATIVGARPQFIKVAPVSKALRSQAEEILIHTGQHYDAGMSDVFFEELGLTPPAHNLGVHGGGHGQMTGAMLQKLEPILSELKPDWVLVYGDTNSTLAGALVAAKLHIPVAHVEAGLRSFNRRMPEEINRIITDQLSDVLFAPTQTAVTHLTDEGMSKDKICLTGDVMYDAALQFSEQAQQRSEILMKAGSTAKNYVLATVHRAENTDHPARLKAIVQALDEIARSIPVILPLHPRTANCMKTQGLQFERVNVIDSVSYLDMVALERNAAAIATDSGGVQKEAFFYNVPCVTLRDETEWVELIDLGWNRLARPGNDNITQTVLDALGSSGKMATPYGDGDAAEIIARRLSAS